MPRSLVLAGSVATLLAALLVTALPALSPDVVRAADIDVRVDACSLLEDSTVAELTGVATTYATDSRTGSSDSHCFWGSTRPGEPGYVELSIVRQHSLSGYSFGDGCDVTTVDDLGEEAAFVDCPPDPQKKISLLAYERGAIVILLVNEPAAGLTADDLATVVRSVLQQLGSVAASEPPAASDDPVDACSLLTAAEVEAVTGLAAEPGVMKETETVGQVGCGFGTVPYEVQVAVYPSLGGAAVDGLGDSGHPVEGVGDGAEWWWCEECLAVDASSSTNRLVVASGTWYVDIGFAPTTDQAADDSELVQATHLEWAVELVRLILPRLEGPVDRPEPSADADPDSAPAGDSGEVGSTDGGSSRPFASSVPTAADVSTDPAVLLQSALLAALLVFLMPFPSQLFNSTLETHEDEVRRWLRLDRVGGAASRIGAFWASWPGVIAFTLLATLLYAFLDPAFGLDVGSLATFLGMLLGIILVTAAFSIPVALAHRRHGDRPSVKVVPISLLVGVACVLLSRLTGFQPGYLYGLLIGLAFARELSAAEEGRATAIGAALMLATAVACWLALGVVPTGGAFALVVVRTALAALMVAGLEGVVFGLLPMRFLPGEPLYAWNRIAWAALLGMGAFAFFHILINPASGYLSDTSRTPLFTVAALLLGFSLVSVGFWAWFRFRPDPTSPVESTH
ncbi:MAG TPA: FGLLP motif-containing membrane protein [Candidatus Limnocylindria bacterium]|nr:FGLLP motif-containing membrane protein [Candidatus Limnocylindria bacterium]